MVHLNLIMICVLFLQTDILQLDVTWLYDSFVGNGNTSNDEVKRVKESLDQDIQKDITAASMSSTKVYKAAELSQSCLSWDELKGMKLASYAPTAILSNHSKVRYCILGTSFISGVMVDAIRASDCGEVYCVCGRTAKTLKEFSDKYDISVTYTDYNDMLNDPSVDVVYIGLPTLMHADWVINCAKAGKHVLNEKSFAITAADTRRAIDVVRHEGVFCMEAQMFRCHPILKKLMSLVHTELPVGSVQSVNATFTADIINLFNRKAGGSILDLGCYPMSLLRLLFGEPKAMTGSATLVKPEKEGDNVFDSASTAEITMESGLRATIFTSNNATHNWEFHIQCENGRISLSDLWRSDVEDAITITSVDKSGNKVEEKILMPLSQNFYTLQINTVNENIRNGNCQATSPAMSWDDSISNMVALDMWRRAIGLNYDGYE
jgi:predicted dehydrogenase